MPIWGVLPRPVPVVVALVTDGIADTEQHVGAVGADGAPGLVHAQVQVVILLLLYTHLKLQWHT